MVAHVPSRCPRLLGSYPMLVLDMAFIHTILLTEHFRGFLVIRFVLRTFSHSVPDLMVFLSSYMHCPELLRSPPDPGHGVRMSDESLHP